MAYKLYKRFHSFVRLKCPKRFATQTRLTDPHAFKKTGTAKKSGKVEVRPCLQTLIHTNETSLASDTSAHKWALTGIVASGTKRRALRGRATSLRPLARPTPTLFVISRF